MEVVQMNEVKLESWKMISFEPIWFLCFFAESHETQMQKIVRLCADLHAEMQ